MKQIFTIVFVLFSMAQSFAQSFTVGSLEEQISLDGTKELIIDVNIANSTSDTVFVTWERTIVRLPDHWTNLICDLQKCYGPNTSTQMFFVPPNSNGDFQIHTTPTTVDYAIIKIKFYEASNPDQAVTGTYTFGQVTSTDDLAIAPIELYPNPATNYFQVDNGQKVNSVEIFNLLGVKVAESTNTQNVDVSSLKAGLYFVRLLDRTEKVITTQRLQKN